MSSPFKKSVVKRLVKRANAARVVFEEIRDELQLLRDDMPADTDKQTEKCDAADEIIERFDNLASEADTAIEAFEDA